MVTDALIIRENNNIGESDRFVTALTRDQGVIRAAVRGARKIKNSRGPATQLLSYSKLTLYRGRDYYMVNDAESISIFFDIRADIEKLALAQYFCELAGVIAPMEEPAEDFLRLMLNCLQFLANDKYHKKQIKAVLELRMLSLAGFQPDLTACVTCKKNESDEMFFFPNQGVLVCGNCHFATGGRPLSKSVLAAMRHIIYSKFENIFSFNLVGDSLKELEKESELFTLSQLNRGFNTLDFYNSLL